MQDTYLFLGTKHSEDLKPEDGSYTEIFSVKQALTLNSRYCLAIAETNLKSSPTPNQIDSNCCTEVLAEGKICLFFRHRKYLPKSLLYYTRCISSYKNYKAYNKASKSNPLPREKTTRTQTTYGTDEQMEDARVSTLYVNTRIAFVKGAGAGSVTFHAFKNERIN